ncbi:hypothetical protein EDD21DRAFT_228891 [Dissophora ornata]|nr:hypothetical protein EDD21DRAFT_228891 [Dissophora ornata]
MVKINLSFVAMAAMVATAATAAPCSQRPMAPILRDVEPNQRIPGTTIKEYHPFFLRSYNLDSFISVLEDERLVVAGFRDGNGDFPQLKLCIVSSDSDCNPDIPSHCIYENVEYRFRVSWPVPGYLRVVGNMVEIVGSFYDASGLSLIREPGWGLRVAKLNHDGSRSVFSTHNPGVPVTLEPIISNDTKQSFEIVELLMNERSRVRS